MATSSVRYGWGVTKEVGWDLADLGARKIVIFTDKNLNNRSSHSSRLSSVETVLASIQEVRSQILVSGGDSSLLSNIQVYDDVECEPTDSSFKDAISFCRSHGNFDAYVAVGGGSVIDTCKAANLYATYPPLLSSSPSSSSEGEDYDFLAYVNPPIGRGLPVPGPLKPLIAIPTTAGTGSETTGVSIFDLVSMKAKTGIAHRRLKPTLGIIDPENTKTLPPQVAAASGFDVLCHSLESYTALPYNKRGPRPAKPLLRPAYQGSNPISDVWSLKALAMVTEFLPRATFDGPNDDDARAQVILAATFAGVGFGNAGVHLCHAMSYPVSGNVKSWKPSGYPGVQHPLIPHGISVVTHAPSVFRFTSLADPERHLHAADIMHQARTKSYLPRSVSSSYSAGDSGRLLADEVIEMMKKLQVPNGLKEMGFEESDIPLLVEGTIPQHRVTKLSPRPVGGEELSALFKDSMSVW